MNNGTPIPKFTKESYASTDGFQSGNDNHNSSWDVEYQKFVNI